VAAPPASFGHGSSRRDGICPILKQGARTVIHAHVRTGQVDRGFSMPADDDLLRIACAGFRAAARPWHGAALRDFRRMVAQPAVRSILSCHGIDRGACDAIANIHLRG